VLAPFDFLTKVPKIRQTAEQLIISQNNEEIINEKDSVSIKKPTYRGSVFSSPIRITGEDVV
jgi:hypothetical protein